MDRWMWFSHSISELIDLVKVRDFLLITRLSEIFFSLRLFLVYTEISYRLWCKHEKICSYSFFNSLQQTRVVYLGFFYQTPALYWFKKKLQSKDFRSADLPNYVSVQPLSALAELHILGFNPYFLWMNSKRFSVILKRIATSWKLYKSFRYDRFPIFNVRYKYV